MEMWVGLPSGMGVKEEEKGLTGTGGRAPRCPPPQIGFLSTYREALGWIKRWVRAAVRFYILG